MTTNGLRHRRCRPTRMLVYDDHDKPGCCESVLTLTVVRMAQQAGYGPAERLTVTKPRLGCTWQH